MRYVNVNTIKSIEFCEEREDMFKIYPPVKKSVMWIFSKTSKWRVSDRDVEGSVFALNYYSIEKFLSKWGKYYKIVGDKVILKSHIEITYINGETENEYFDNNKDGIKAFGNLMDKLDIH